MRRIIVAARDMGIWVAVIAAATVAITAASGYRAAPHHAASPGISFGAGPGWEPAANEYRGPTPEQVERAWIGGSDQADAHLE